MKLGIIGSGNIVKEFLPATASLDNLKLTAIATTKRSFKVGQNLAKQYGIDYCYDDYCEMLKNPQADTVYIGTPSAMHYKMSKDALLAGKNVICEKPFVFKESEALELKKIADEKDVMIVEAITNIYLQNFKQMEQDLPLLGKIHAVNLNFTQYSGELYEQFLKGKPTTSFSPELGGGALMDINVYNVHLAVKLFGSPSAVHYFPNIQNSSDTSGLLVLNYPDKQASLLAAKDSDAMDNNRSMIEGEKGSIWFEGSPGRLNEYTLALRGQKPVTRRLNKYPHKMISEFTEFIRMFEQHDQETVDEAFDHTLEVIKVLEKARKDMN